MRARKTVNVSELIDWANELLSLKQNEWITIDYKQGICSMLEKVLLKSGAYNGFMFINADDCEAYSFGYVSRKYFKK